MSTQRRLRAKQEAFVREYVLDLNAAAAACRAGYSRRAGKEIGYRLLTLAHVKARIAELQEGHLKRADSKAQDVLQHISRIALSDIREFVDVDEHGVIQVRSIGDLPEGASHCLRKVKSRARQYKDKAGRQVTESIVEIELWDKLPALGMLVKRHGLSIGDGGEGGEKVDNVTNFIFSTVEASSKTGGKGG